MKFLRQIIFGLILSVLWVNGTQVKASEATVTSAPSLRTYLETKGFEIEPFPCLSISEQDLQESNEKSEDKSKKVHAHQTCLIEANSEVGEEDFNSFEKSFQEGHDMMIFGQQEVLNFFKVDFYQDDIPSGSQIISSKNSLNFINDSVGEKEFSQCIRQKIIHPFQDGAPMVIQWICSQGGVDHLQKITFISPDIVFLFAEQRDAIFEGIKKEGSFIKEGQYEEMRTEKNISWAKIIIFVGLIVGALWFVIIIRKLIGFIKKEPKLLIKRVAWGLLFSAIVMIILYILEISSKSVLEIYVLFYIVASIGLAKAWGELSSESVFQQLFPGNNKESFFQQWSLRLVSICGVGWLYAFFLWPAHQMIPVIGLLIGASMLIITNGYSRVESKKYQEIIFKPLKWLPLIFLGVALWSNFSVSNQQKWTLENVGSKQGITLTNLNGKALNGLSSDSGMILSEPTLIIVDNPNKIVGRNYKSATIYASIESKKALNLVSKNGKTSHEKSIFSIPNQEKYSLIAKHKISGLEFYRNRSAPFIEIPQDQTIQEILDSQFNENNVLTDLSQEFKKHYVIKPTFGFSAPIVAEETDTDEVITAEGSVWDVRLAGNHDYEFFVEAKEEPFSLDLYLTKFGTKAMGAEFIDISILNNKGINKAFYHEEIKYDAYQDRSQHIHIEQKLNPGIYRIQLQSIEGSQIYLQENTETAYQFDRIESSSPTMIFYVNNMKIFGSGEIVFYDVGDQTIIEQGSVKKINFRKNILETISFSDGGGSIHSDSPLLIASSFEKWRSPFTVNRIKDVRSTTNYILMEEGALGEATQSEEEMIIGKTFNIPKKKEKLYWQIIPIVESGEKAFYSIKEITIKFL